MCGSSAFLHYTSMEIGIPRCGLMQISRSLWVLTVLAYRVLAIVLLSTIKLVHAWEKGFCKGFLKNGYLLLYMYGVSIVQIKSVTSCGPKWRFGTIWIIINNRLHWLCLLGEQSCGVILVIKQLMHMSLCLVLNPHTWILQWSFQ